MRGRSSRRPATGIVLVDTGHPRGGRASKSWSARCALTGHRLEDVELLVCTHAHSDHYGLAAPIVEAAGCELWMHPRHAHMSRARRGPRARAGAPDRGRPPERRAARAAAALGGRAARLRRRASRAWSSRTRELVTGVEVETEHGRWTVHETPGHAPSHVVPVPARPAAAAQRRPPARPGVALLRLRLDARPGGRVPRRAWTRSRRSTRASAFPVTAARSATSGAHRGEPDGDPERVESERSRRSGSSEVTAFELVPQASSATESSR